MIASNSVQSFKLNISNNLKGMKCKMYIVNDKLPIFENFTITFDFLRIASNFCNNINKINTVVFAVIINAILAGKKVRIASPVVVAHLAFVNIEYTIKEIETVPEQTSSWWKWW